MSKRDQTDWVDDAEERRYKEEQEHARRKARQEKYDQRQESEGPAQDRTRAKTPRGR